MNLCIDAWQITAGSHRQDRCRPRIRRLRLTPRQPACVPRALERQHLQGSDGHAACRSIDPWHQSRRHAGDSRHLSTPLEREDLDEFVACYQPANRHARKATWSQENPDGRWRAYDLEELLQRDKVSLDLFWLRDESLEDSANLPPPGVIAAEIVEELRTALEQFELIEADLAGLR